jgi:hypothetical protein
MYRQDYGRAVFFNMPLKAIVHTQSYFSVDVYREIQLGVYNATAYLFFSEYTLTARCLVYFYGLYSPHYCDRRMLGLNPGLMRCTQSCQPLGYTSTTIGYISSTTKPTSHPQTGRHLIDKLGYISSTTRLHLIHKLGYIRFTKGLHLILNRLQLIHKLGYISTH